MRRIVTAALTLSLLAAACGGDALSEEDLAVAAALADTIESAEPELLSYLAGGQADVDCWAEKMVGDLGVDAVTPIAGAVTREEVDEGFASLPDGDRDKAADALNGCIDREALKDDMLEFVDEPVIDCVMDTVLEDGSFRESFAAIVSGDWDYLDALEAEMSTECGF